MITKQQITELFVTKQNHLRNLCRRTGIKYQFIDDVIADVFLDLLRRRDSIEIKTATLYTYVVKSVWNGAVWEIKRQKRFVELPDLAELPIVFTDEHKSILDELVGQEDWSVFEGLRLSKAEKKVIERFERQDYQWLRGFPPSHSDQCALTRLRSKLRKKLTASGSKVRVPKSSAA